MTGRKGCSLLPGLRRRDRMVRGGQDGADLVVACGYMALVADFGEHEHVFSPVCATLFQL
jgi:hypothetical protein